MSYICAANLLHGANVGANPTITSGDATSVFEGIQTAYRAGHKSVTIPPGIYRFESKPGFNGYLRFRDMKDFTIDATGATFVFTDIIERQILFSKCERVTFRGANITQYPLPFYQGKIEAISSDRRLVDVRIATGYLPDPEKLPTISTIYFYDPATRQLKPDTIEKYCPKVERLTPGLVRFHLASAIEDDMPIVIGDLVAWRGKGGATLTLDQCANMTISGVTIRNGTGFCFKEEFGAGDNHYDHISVTYGDRPAGATEDPLLSSNADAFHSRSVRKGPTVKNFLFEGMGDDGFAIHCFYAMAIESQGNKIIVDWRGQPYLEGDTLRFQDSNRAVVAEAKVLSCRKLPDWKRTPEIPKNVGKEFRNPEEGSYYELTLDHSVPAKLGWLVANASACGNGFTVSNGVIRNHRARSMLIKAGEGVIENCTFEGSTMNAIVVGPEQTHWNEGDYSCNLVIRNNTFLRGGISRDRNYKMAGLVSIASYEGGQFVPLPGGHRNIVVENNIFKNNDGVHILASSASGIQIRNNHFINPMREPSVRGVAIGVDPTAIVWMTQCDHVQVKGNAATNPGPYLKKLVGGTSSVYGTAGEDNIQNQ